METLQIGDFLFLKPFFHYEHLDKWKKYILLYIKVKKEKQLQESEMIENIYLRARTFASLRVLNLNLTMHNHLLNMIVVHYKYRSLN